RSTAGAFAEYTEAVVGRLGDRVSDLMTFNEPWCSSILGYVIGEHAPGLMERDAGLEAAHHLMLAHGFAVPIIQDAGARAGIVLNQ
ncbi:beta-glucosidase, partial [Enterococcus hirae]